MKITAKEGLAVVVWFCHLCSLASCSFLLFFMDLKMFSDCDRKNNDILELSKLRQHDDYILKERLHIHWVCVNWEYWLYE